MRATHRVKGFTLTEILIVVGIIGVLASIAVPNFMKARAAAQAKVCIENLTKIEGAKQLFGVEKGKKDGDNVDPSDLFGEDLYIKKTPQCPASGTYLINPIGVDAECSLGPTLDHKL